MAAYRYGTPSPLGIQNDRELNDLSPTSQDPFYAGSGHTPLHEPFGASNNYNFPQHNVPPLQGGLPAMEPSGAANNYNNPNRASHPWQGSNLTRDQAPNPNSYNFQHHPALPIANHNVPAIHRGNAGSITATEQPFDLPGGRDMDPDDELLLQETDVRWRAVAKPLRLGRATVMCLIFNRMIGTGIFRTPATVYNFTQDKGISMAWWALGAVSAIAGIVMYMELGHTIPIYRFGNQLVSVPRNGGELNYLKYIYQRPAFFTTCVFGISFILLGHVAMNGIAFGIAILDAAGQGGIAKHDAVVRGIALCVSFGACFLHGTWRQGGIYLNNVLAVFKIGVLLLIFILGMCTHGGAFPKASETSKLPQVALLKSPAPYTPDAYGYAESFLAILFAFGGLNQANYVIGEVDDPRRRYKWPAFSAVVIVSALYLLCNWAYFIVVPTKLFIPGNPMSVAHHLFRYTLGTLNPEWETRAPQMLSAFVAISALGNIIVMTYTAARVKQEIAKEGIIPFRKFFAGSMTTFRIPVRKLWGSKKETLPEDVPIGALVLHFTVSAILILATWKITAIKTYGVLVDLYSYTVDAIFGTFLAFGLIYLRFFSKRDWAKHSWNSGFRIPAYISFFAAFLFGIANLYPIAAKWVPPLTDAVRQSLAAPWWLTGTVGFIILGIGIVWWFGFRYIIPRFGVGRVGRVLIVTRKLWFKEEDGYKVLEFEDVDFKWVTRNPDQEGHGGMDDSTPVDDWAGGRIRERTFNAGPKEVENRLQREYAPRVEVGGGDEGVQHRNGWHMPQMYHHNAAHEMHAAGSTPRFT